MIFSRTCCFPLLGFFIFESIIGPSGFIGLSHLTDESDSILSAPGPIFLTRVGTRWFHWIQWSHYSYTQTMIL